MPSLATYPLRLPHSMRAGLEKFSKLDGVSINQFVNVAVAEKLAMLQAEDYFQSRAAKADLAAFDRLMARPSGQSLRSGDEL